MQWQWLQELAKCSILYSYVAIAVTDKIYVQISISLEKCQN